MKRYHLCFCLVLLFLPTLLTACGESAANPPINQKHEVTQEDLALAERLLADKQIEVDDRILAAVANDMQRLENTFWREAVSIEEIKGTDIIYSITFDAAGIKDLIRVTEDGSGPINVLVREGEHKDSWVFRSSGQVVCNGLSMRTHCTDSKGGDATLQTISPALLYQDAPAGERLIQDPKYQNDGTSTLQIGSVPMPDGDPALSSRLNMLSIHVADNLTFLTDGASGEALAAAVAKALAENRERASQVLTDGSASYILYEYTSEQAAAYVVDTYANDDFSGDHFVWGILETPNK